MQTVEKHREVFQSHAGIWDATFAKFMFGPVVSPMLTSGVETNRLLNGGNWLIMSQHYEYPGGVFEGWGMYGFDPQKDRYVGSWADSTNTHLNVSEGTYDAETRSLTLIAEGVDPTTGEQVRVKQVISQKDDDTKVFQVFRSREDGPDMKLLEVEAKRRK